MNSGERLWIARVLVKIGIRVSTGHSVFVIRGALGTREVLVFPFVPLLHAPRPTSAFFFRTGIAKPTQNKYAALRTMKYILAFNNEF